MRLLRQMVRKDEPQENRPIRALSIVHHRAPGDEKLFPDFMSESVEVLRCTEGSDLKADIEVIGVDEIHPRIGRDLMRGKLREFKEMLGSRNETFCSFRAPEEPELESIGPATALK